MSDFDKEAERRRLREKYESDREDREATQRMSELLLQGATMTNRHCDTCGDPIFRYEGQEFCPTCQSAAVGIVEEGDAPDETEAAQSTDTAARPERVADAGSEATPAENATATESPTADASAGRAAAPSADVGDQRGAESTPAGEANGRVTAGTPTGAGGRAGEASTGRSGVTPDEGGDLGAARASLVRTLTRLARAAESTDDPRRAREYLTAAREAAEAVAALDRS